MVEQAGLENQCPHSGDRGFESHPLRMLKLIYDSSFPIIIFNGVLSVVEFHQKNLYTNPSLKNNQQL